MSTHSRGYGRAHQKLRNHWRPLVEAGGVVCWRCGLVIDPEDAWHLGHDDHDRGVYRGPEHVGCNLGGRNARYSRTRPPEPHPNRRA
jgi:hypothetical protein